MADTDPKSDPLDVKDLEPETPAKKGNPNRGPGGKFAPAPGGATRKPKGAKLSDAALREKCTGMLAAIGLALYTRDQPCGGAVIAGAENLVDSLVEWGKENPSVRRTLELFATTSTVGNVLTASAAIIFPVAAHHGLLPQQLASLGAVLTGAAPPPVVEPVVPVVVDGEEWGPPVGVRIAEPMDYPPAAPSDDENVVLAETVTV